MKNFTQRMVCALALLTACAGVGGCLLQTPPSSSWATDVYHARFSSLTPAMPTEQVLEIMCVQGPHREDGPTVTYDLTQGYTLTLFFEGGRDHPKEVVLHTPYEHFATRWTRQLSDAEQAIGAVTGPVIR